MAAHNPLAAKLAATGRLRRDLGQRLRTVGLIRGAGRQHSVGRYASGADACDRRGTRRTGHRRHDTGYGNAVNVAYLVPRYTAAGVAAVVIEDKTFPKDSSLRPGGRQVLVPLEEFQGKIEAARLPGGPLVVARTEALIAGLGQDWALRRGISYAEAGADAVLIRSREKTPAEILEFCHAWPGPVPLVLVPTAYPQLSFAEIAALRKVGLIICANHAIRAAVAAMRETFARILTEGGIAGAESRIASVAEIFDLQGDGRMRDLERRFPR